MQLAEVEVACCGCVWRNAAGTRGADAVRAAAAARGWRAGALSGGCAHRRGAAVLYPLGNDVGVPLTVRASDAGAPRRPDQPAGRRRRSRETLAETALREASEEIGVDPAAVRVLGELTPVHVLVSGFTLHPIVGVTDTAPAFIAAPGEVEEILEVSLDDLRDASTIRRGTRDPRRRGGRVSLLRSARTPGLGRDRDDPRRIHLSAA